jgi:thiosulfate dehydrogenase [quinone] large subunit
MTAIKIVTGRSGVLRTFALTTAPSATGVASAGTRPADALRMASLALLSIRFIQGFIYWGGGSRRFIYAPAKLDPNVGRYGVEPSVDVRDHQ